MTTERPRHPVFTLRTIGALLAVFAFATACTETIDEPAAPAQEQSMPAADATAEPGAAGSTRTGADTSGGKTNGSTAERAAVSELSKVVDKVKPATVQITNQQLEFGASRQPYEVPAGVGTGVIYSKDGYILTNHHVIEGARGLQVSLPDGASYPARLVGSDPRTDLAVLKVDGSNLPVAGFGDSSQLVVGEWTVAIGNALGLPGGPTVTAGVVSALDRTAQEPANGGSGAFLYGLIQTDAAINPGNSGGPLINLAGEVIGINTMIAGQIAPGLQAQGIGFAININSAKDIAEELVRNGSVRHAFLGVNYVPLTPGIADRLGTTEKHGVAIVEVVPGSPASQAGLQSRDVVTRIAGKDIRGESDLAKYVDMQKPGDRVELVVVRNGERRELSVTLGTAPEL